MLFTLIFFFILGRIVMTTLRSIGFLCSTTMVVTEKNWNTRWLTIDRLWTLALVTTVVALLVSIENTWVCSYSTTDNGNLELLRSYLQQNIFPSIRYISQMVHKTVHGISNWIYSAYKDSIPLLQPSAIVSCHTWFQCRIYEHTIVHFAWNWYDLIARVAIKMNKYYKFKSTNLNVEMQWCTNHNQLKNIHLPICSQ